ncbi:MAG: hypothetical protein MUE73_20725, partial [Planctomycetes bacterium]|nr:hypothetical protein [Planctomycetota bacterium]
WPALRPRPGGETEAAHLAGLAFRPALLLLAEAATPWRQASSIPGDEWCIRQSRLYLGGRLPGGRLGALPMFVDPAAEGEVMLFGAARGRPRFATLGSLELRITRGDAGVRYRFGHYAGDCEGPRRFDGGDVRLPPEAALAPGEGPLLPALACLLRERFATTNGPRAAVWLEVGEAVRFVDVLRAVECADGNPEVVILEARRLFQREFEFLRLPGPREVADGAALVEDFDQPGRVILGVNLTDDDNGTEVRERGRVLAPEKIPASLEGRNTVLVRAEARARWGDLRALVAIVRDRGLALQFAFPEEEEGFEPERFLAVPPPPEGAAVTEVAVRTAEGGAWTLAPDPGDPRGRAFRLTAPDDTPTEAVLQAVLHLLARGAAGIGL